MSVVLSTPQFGTKGYARYHVPFLASHETHIRGLSHAGRDAGVIAEHGRAHPPIEARRLDAGMQCFGGILAQQCYTLRITTHRHTHLQCTLHVLGRDVETDAQLGFHGVDVLQECVSTLRQREAQKLGPVDCVDEAQEQIADFQRFALTPIPHDHDKLLP